MSHRHSKLSRTPTRQVALARPKLPQDPLPGSGSGSASPWVPLGWRGSRTGLQVAHRPRAALPPGLLGAAARGPGRGASSAPSAAPGGKARPGKAGDGCRKSEAPLRGRPLKGRPRAAMAGETGTLRPRSRPPASPGPVAAATATDQKSPASESPLRPHVTPSRILHLGAAQGHAGICCVWRTAIARGAGSCGFCKKLQTAWLPLDFVVEAD